MLEYEIALILHTVGPYLIITLAIITGVVISNLFWRSRVYRFAKAEIIQTLELQKNKIEQLEEKLREKKEIISDLKAFQKRAKISALKIVEGK